MSHTQLYLAYVKARTTSPFWTYQFLFIQAPHAITGSSWKALWHFCCLDLVSSLLDPVGLAHRTRLLA